MKQIKFVAVGICFIFFLFANISVKFDESTSSNEYSIMAVSVANTEKILDTRTFYCSTCYGYGFDAIEIVCLWWPIQDCTSMPCHGGWC